MIFMEIVLVMSVIPVTMQHMVTTAQGQVRGVDRVGYVSYMGIPYATIDNNEIYKQGGLAPVWDVVRDSYVSHCSAVSVEDCLQLDVHVPSTARGPWPVLVWVSGGTGQYNTRQLVIQQIIVVVVHHRVGPAGFLCTKNAKIPGNAAAKDVVVALRWVRDNIVAFKGNAAHVVVGGQGMGAAIVEAVMLSPMSQGLFHGVILQSGTVLSPWAFNYDAYQRADKLSQLVTKERNKTMAILNAKLDDIVDKLSKLDVPYIPLGLCVEKKHKEEESLLTVAPLELLTTKKYEKVPMIIGYNSDEAYIFASILKESKKYLSMADDRALLIPQELKFGNNREKNQMGRQMEEIYFKNNVSMKSLLMYHRDAYFVSHIYRSARLHASSHPVYLYQFSYNSTELGVLVEPKIKKLGAAHSDELAFLFSGSNLEGNEEVVQKTLVHLWTNFVKNLDPTHLRNIKWDILDPELPRLMNIGVELKMMEYPHTKESAMWDDVYQKYYYNRNTHN